MFWERFYDLCVTHNTKPNPVAKELGIASSAVTRWKTGGLPNSTTVNKLADYFGVSVDYLLGNSDKKEKLTADGGEQFADIQYRRALEIMEKLSPEKQELALRLLKTLAEEDSQDLP